ncbi:hypothetical protein [Micromonospora sp. NPDC005171]|uniref:hypothetical protein n=1 Tax=Micromonospora sp. NPDC005171 TaxID=3156866 RepID=UPI0033A4A9DD
MAFGADASALAALCGEDVWVSGVGVASPAWTSLAIAGTVLPPAEASTTIARRNRIADPVPRLAIRSSC